MFISYSESYQPVWTTIILHLPFYLTNAMPSKTPGTHVPHYTRQGLHYVGKWDWPRPRAATSVATRICDFPLRNSAKKIHTRTLVSIEYVLLDNSLVSQFYVLTFRNCLSHLHRQVGVCRIVHNTTSLWRWNRQRVQKRGHITFRRQEITHKNAYII